MRTRLAALLLGLLPLAAHAQAPVVAYTNLQWTFSTAHPSWSGCNELVLDAMGNFTSGVSFLLTGYMGCVINATPGQTSVMGNGWLGNGTASMRLRLPNGDQLFCENLSLQTLSGACRMQSSLATDAGAATVTFR